MTIEVRDIYITVTIHSYSRAIGPRNWIREHSHGESSNWCKESQAKP
jgi:hypothetical protein